MPIGRLLIRIAIVGLLVLAHADDAAACSCIASGPPCQQAFQADAVFSGTVRSITVVPDERPTEPGTYRSPRGVRVRLVNVMGHLGMRGAEVEITTAFGSDACGFTFEQGKQYLVYAYRSSEGFLSVSKCSRTRRLAEATEDLRFLKSIASPVAARPRVSGTVRHMESDFATGDTIEDGPMPDVPVRARGPSGTFDARTDGEGRYELTLPPGRYDVTPLVPTGFSERHLQRIVELRDARACYVADFFIHFDGRIRGAIDSGGRPAAGITVEVMAADVDISSPFLNRASASTDAEGRFEITDLSPGQYVVGVDLTPRMNPDRVYPRTFHPGTADLDSATVVELDGGERRDLEPMSLPPPRRQRHLTGRITFADGRPAAGALVSLQDGRGIPRQVAAGVETDAEGRFTFVVYEGLSYMARAFVNMPFQRQPQGTSGPFVIIGDPPPIEVVLSDDR